MAETGRSRVSRATYRAIAACAFAVLAGCNNPGGTTTVSPGTPAHQEPATTVNGGGSGQPGQAQYVGLLASFNPQSLLGVGGDGAGGAGDDEPTVLGPPYGTSVSCGDAIVGPDEECDDGSAGAPNDDDACTNECQTRDQAGGPAPTMAQPPSDRYLGFGRHPVSGLDDGFITTYMQAGGEDPAIGATLFNIWGQPSTFVTMSEGASPIFEANPVAAALPNGRYVVAWGDFDGDGSDLGVALREVGADGDLGQLRSANASHEFSQLNPDLIWTGSQLVAAWEDYSDAFNGPDLRYRVFDEELNPVTGDLALAASELPEAGVALAAFRGGWAAAYREGAVDGSESVVVRIGDDTFRFGPIYGGPLEDRPALVELDATHLLLVVSAGTDPAATGIYNVPRLRYVVIDTDAEQQADLQAFDPLDDVLTREGQTAQLSPAAAPGNGGAHVAWRSEGRVRDPAGDQLWLKYLRWQPAAEPQLEIREVEALLPRLCEGSVGDQRTPALARTALPPFGGLAIAWDDFAKRIGEGEPDVVVHYAPTHPHDPTAATAFDEPWTGAEGADWSSHWTMESITGTNIASLDRERGKLRSPSASGSALLFVNHYEALNVDAATDLRFELNGSYGGIVARRADIDPDSYLVARIGTVAQDVHWRIYAMIDNVKTDIATTVLPTAFSAFAQRLSYRMRFRVFTDNGDIKVAAKYWSVDVSEPGTWMLEETVPSTSPIAIRLANRAGRFGLYASNGITTGRSVMFDNFHATFFEGTAAANWATPVYQPAPLRRGKARYRPCTDTTQCGPAEGCCFDSTDCAPGLTCAAAASNKTPWPTLGSHAKTCALSHCANQQLDADEEWVDCGGADCAPCACASTAAPGSSAYCTASCPCGAGGVDCHNDLNCISGTICVQELGYKYGFVQGTDACTPSHCRDRVVDGDEPDPTRPDWGGSCGSPACSTENGSYAHCSVFCKCASGHGDCAYNTDCEAGLLCIGDRGARFGLGAGVDICLPPHCFNNVLDADETTKDCGGADCGSPCP